MNGAFYVGAVGLQAQQRALEMISSNIANVNTPAFKRSDVQFAEMMATRMNPDVASASPDVGSVSAGVAATASLTVNEAGDLETTGNAMDVAIQGTGFIELVGPGGQTQLWRGGRLKVGTDGLLTAAASGLPLKAAINVPSDAASITIGQDGVVQAVSASGTTSDIGKIELVRSNAPDAMRALDGGLFVAPDETTLTSFAPGDDGIGVLKQGQAEHSNVDLTTQMVQLMLVQRSYAANAQVVQAADQLMGLANGLRRRSPWLYSLPPS